MASNRVREALHASMVSRQQNELELWTTLAAGNFAPRVDFPAAYAGQVGWEFNGQIYPATSGAAIAAPALGGMQRAILRGVPLSEITWLESTSSGFQGDLTNFRPERCRRMTYLRLQTNSFSGDLSGWSIPSVMTYLHLGSNSFSGDLSGWVLPSVMTVLSLYSNSFSGDLSGWVLPSVMTVLSLYSNSFSGDLSGWVLPSVMTYLYLYSNSFSGDLSGWVIPSVMTVLSLSANSFSGDLSGWVLPSAMTDLRLQSNSFTGDLSGWSIPSVMTYLSLNANSFTGDLSGWSIPSVMTYLYLNANSFTGDLSGWSIPSVMTILYLYSNSFRVLSTFAGIGTGMRDFRIQDNTLPQGDVDNVIESIWTARSGFSYVAPALNIGGTNVAPSGTYAAPSEGANWHEDAPGHWTPLTGKAMAYDLQNDVNSEGFNTWTITYTA